MTSAVASSITDAMSLMMSVLVRSSVFTEPRGVSSRFTIFDTSFTFA